MSLDSHLPFPAAHKKTVSHSAMSTSLSIENLIDSETPSSTSELLELDYDVMSFKKLYASLTMIEELTDRLGDLSSFLPAMEETLKFFSSFTFIYRYCGKEVCSSCCFVRELYSVINTDCGVGRGNGVF